MRKILFVLLTAIAVFVLAFPVFVEWHFSKNVNGNVEYSFTGGNEVAYLFDAAGAIDLDQGDCAETFQIELRAGLLSYVFRPTVKVYIDSSVRVFYFEYGAKGRKYLPLSLDGEPCGVAARVETSPGLILEDEVINRSLDLNRPKKVLLLSPHPDDAEIAAHGFYSEFHPVIVTITAGDRGKSFLDSMISGDYEKYRHKGLLRSHDSIFIPVLAGIDHQDAINLGYPTGDLKTMHDSPDSVIQGRYSGFNNSAYYRSLNVNKKYRVSTDYQWRRLVSDLVDLIKGYNPDTIITPHPMLDLHIDHRMTSAALSEALSESGVNSVKLIYLYSNHSSEGESFPYGGNDGYVPLMHPLSNTVQYKGIYSHSLIERQLRRKFIALEHMHDLRSYDCRGILNCSSYFQSTKFRLMNFFDVGSDYYRRAVRPNEVFYLQTPNQFKRLIDAS